jgi:hypothetical protein
MSNDRRKKYIEVMTLIRRELLNVGIKTKVTSVALTGSCYFEFEEPRMGKARVGDHNERERYGYRWQIRADIKTPYRDLSKGHPRFFYPFDKLEVVIAHMINYHASIKKRDGALLEKLKGVPKVDELRSGPLKGKGYKPDGCVCGLPPWELCVENCPHAIK